MYMLSLSPFQLRLHPAVPNGKNSPTSFYSVLILQLGNVTFRCVAYFTDIPTIYSSALLQPPTENPYAHDEPVQYESTAERRARPWSLARWMGFRPVAETVLKTY